MKKLYISPITTLTTIRSEQPITTSMAVNNTEKVSDTQNIGFVKGDNTSRGSQSVWDDDWSD
ncbi:MAG: hypothetical protein IJT75_00290 [Bacteroidaceae bacterium]|nr:hypothetical protein [Bacteroidaceae bacterium]